MAETAETSNFDEFKGKDCAFEAGWLKRRKGLHKLCSVFEGVYERFMSIRLGRVDDYSNKMIARSVKDYSTNFGLKLGITFSFKSSAHVVDRCLFPTKLLNSREKRFTVNDFSCNNCKICD